uniref:Dendritic cell associated nuclear protein 1 n=1 Tax=Cebus imitator TaxID=2715852 RepID=A0A2K5RXB3_CEBIM
MHYRAAAHIQNLRSHGLETAPEHQRLERGAGGETPESPAVTWLHHRNLGTSSRPGWEGARKHLACCFRLHQFTVHTSSPGNSHLALYQVFKTVKLCPSETPLLLSRKSLKSSDPWHPCSLSPNSWNCQAGFRSWSSHLISLSSTCSDSQSRRVSSSQQSPLPSLSSHCRAAHMPE